MTAPFGAPPADSYDLVVAGSGAAALMAAAVAAERGLRRQAATSMARRR